MHWRFLICQGKWFFMLLNDLRTISLPCLSHSYTSCCWISLSRYGNITWLVSAEVNLARRFDNGKINSSPVSRSPAIVRWQEGCPQFLRIPVEDADGDFVKCRWANYTESSFNLGSFSYGILDEVLVMWIVPFHPSIYSTIHPNCPFHSRYSDRLIGGVGRAVLGGGEGGGKIGYNVAMQITVLLLI